VGINSWGWAWDATGTIGVGDTVAVGREIGGEVGDGAEAVAPPPQATINRSVKIIGRPAIKPAFK
jgi:hypothetical protein